MLSFVATTITRPPSGCRSSLQPLGPGKLGQVGEGQLVERWASVPPTIHVPARHEAKDVLAADGIADHHVGEPVGDEQMLRGAVGIDVGARLDDGNNQGCGPLFPGVPGRAAARRTGARLSTRVANDFRAAWREADRDLAVQVAQEHDAVLAADAFFIELEVLVGMAFTQEGASTSMVNLQDQFIVARDLEAGH